MMKGKIAAIFWLALLATSCEIGKETKQSFKYGDEWVLKEYINGEKGFFCDGMEVFKGKVLSYEVHEWEKRDPIFEFETKAGRVLYSIVGLSLTDEGNSSFDFVGEEEDKPDYIIAKGEEACAVFGIDRKKIIGKDRGYDSIQYSAPCFSVKQGDAVGYCDLSGKVIIPPGAYEAVSMDTFTDEYHNREVLRGFYVGMDGDKGDQIGSGLGYRSYGNNGSIGYCNSGGGIVVPPAYKRMKTLSVDDEYYFPYFCFVGDENDEYGVYSQGGNLILRMGKYGESHHDIELNYDQYDDFPWIEFYEDSKNTNKVFIDSTGTVLISHESRLVTHQDGDWLVWSETEHDWVEYVFPLAEGLFTHTRVGMSFTDWVKLYDDKLLIGTRYFRYLGESNGLHRFADMSYTMNYLTTTSNYYANDDLSVLYWESVCEGGWALVPPSVDRVYFHRVSDQGAPTYAGVAPTFDNGFFNNPGMQNQIPVQPQDNRQYRTKEVVTYEPCTTCDGKGTVIKYTDPLSFRIDDSKYCSECGRTMSPHYHESCPSCHGNKQVKKVTYQTVYE